MAGLNCLSLLLSSSIFRYNLKAMERCPSGSWCRSRKAVFAQAERGFESHPLRQDKTHNSARIRHTMGKINFTDLLSEDPKIKYSCTKNVLVVAKENPAELYSELDFFVELLDSENKILKWTAIDVIGALAKVDKARAVAKLRDRIVGLLNTGNMITAHHAIAALTDIALARPEYQPAITNELLKVEHYSYDTDECRNITIGKVILGISTYFGALERKRATIEF